jgi:flagellar M-ring protein FliF
MANGVSDLLNQFTSSPARGRNLSIAVILILAIVGFGSLIFWNSQPEYQVLFSNLSQEDAGEMITKLKEKKIPYQLSQGGTALSVPRDQVYELRLSLTAEGLPKGGGVGFEVFDRTNLGVTDFVQKLNYQRALQGELSRTIQQIKEIEHARVHIVTPKESLFVDEQKKATASVFIKTKSGMALSSSQVEGIVHLVSASIEGLDPGNITVVDTSGKMLTKRMDSSPIGQLTTTQLDYQRNMEEGLKKKVQGMLEEVLGPNKAIARVSMDLDFQQVDITEERFDPQTILRSEQKNTERSLSTSGGSGGVSATEMQAAASADPKNPKPKAASPAETLPKPPVALSQPHNANSSERQNEIRNYEISRVNKHVRNPVGQVKKVSAAVVVDGVYKEVADAKGVKGKQYAPRSPEEMKGFENIVKKAVGYSEERGDQIEVINIPFYSSVVEEDTRTAPKNPWWQEYLMTYYKPAVSLLLGFLFLFFVLRPMLKKRVFSPAEGLVQLQPAAAAAGPAPSAISGAAPREIQNDAKREPQPVLSVKDQTVKLIQDDPARTVGIVKTWLSEKE